MYKRVIVYGSVGSGKTTFAKRLSKAMKIPCYSTDEMVFDETEIKTVPEKVRDKRLKKVSSKNSWIVEGVHHAEWTMPLLKKVQVIILLDYKKRILYSRVLKRFKEGRKLKNPHGTLRSVSFLLYYVFKYKGAHYLPKKEFPLKNNGKFFIANNDKEADLILKKLTSSHNF